MAKLPDGKQQALLAGLCVLLAWHSAAAYQLAQRWTNTSSGATGALGNPITLTWGFAAEGAPVPQLGSSNLISFLDTNFGSGVGGDDLTQRPWFQHFEYAFDRWSQLGGVTYVYEPYDDGLELGSFPGFTGIRGDVRIGGTLIDGGGGVLGYGDFPNNGDLVLDTGDQAFYSNPDLDFRRMHTVLMHEHGHGLGLAHVESTNAAFLMERFLSLAFDGPQLDDIRGLHRAYGDWHEKRNSGLGNNDTSHATPLGMLEDGATVSIGRDGGDTYVAPSEVDFISIDDSSDIDFFSFDVRWPSLLNASLTPLGPSYLEGPPGGPQSLLDSAAVSDLALTVFDSDGITILGTANTAIAGQIEFIEGLDLPASGRYFARVTGTANDIQLYQLDVNAITVPEPAAAVLLALGLVLWCAVSRR